MRILALDPGAKRMGYAVVENGPTYLASGIKGLERHNQLYQSYRLDLIGYFQEIGNKLIDEHQPDVMVSEILPIRGFRDMSQAFLASTAVTVMQTVAVSRNVVLGQVAAQTVKVAMTNNPRATKVGVRNGMVKFFPELTQKAKGWTKEFDESDAIAVGLTYLGYEI